jgi:hypothetical protein
MLILQSIHDDKSEQRKTQIIKMSQPEFEPALYTIDLRPIPKLS